jgi:hypothetical protein
VSATGVVASSLHVDVGRATEPGHVIVERAALLGAAVYAL